MNPLESIALPIPFDAVRPEHIVPAVDALLTIAERRLDAIRSNPRTFDGTLGVLDQASTELDYAVTIASHLESVSGTPELREAFGSILPKVSEFSSKVLLSTPIYQALVELSQTEEAKHYDSARARFLRKTLDDFRRNGAELPEAGKARLSEIDVELSELALRFSQNVVDSTLAFEVLVDDAAELSGLPESALSAARRSAEEKGKSGYRLTLQAPSYGPVMTFANSRALRQKMYFANITRATSGAIDNRGVLERMLALRAEKAKLLGFSNFADLVTQDRMARTGKGALDFVTMLTEKLRPAFEKENQELAAFAKAHGHPGELEPWDVAYWAEKQRRALYAFDEETLRPYHPVDQVMRGMFEIAQALFGIRIERDAQAPVWHPSVSAWRVDDEHGHHLGAFYTDLFPRDNKRDGAWMSGVVDRASTGARVSNVAVFVANVTPPQSPGAPALLNKREVETLFHEFGHTLHHLLSNVSIRSMAGTRVVSDFVELPSMIMENWTWESEALDRFARHVQTREPIAADVKERMLAARTYRAANALMRQLGFSTVDLMLHMHERSDADGDVMTYARQVFERFSPTPLPSSYAMLASFSHLFGSAYGYAAGYYSYQWSEVLEADAFGRFRAEGILNRQVGQAFRDAILSRGDSADPGDLYREFLGRDPDVSALLRRLGLIAGDS